MDYELAKELKDAGFPQPTLYDTPNGTWRWANPDDKDDIERAYVPFLEELIEACGEHFRDLARERARQGMTIGWCAWDSDGKDHEGSTPTEAVAKLWLALNTKTV